MQKRSLFSWLVISCLVLLFTACKKDDDIIPTDNPSFQGNFVSVAHTTSGMASTDQDEATLTLSTFKTDSGPDLNIYLSSGINNITDDFIDLGNIKGVNGSYSYDLPNNVDFLHHKYVIVWCVDFNVNFGYAELIPQ